ncbi:hypothetical protein AB0M20_26990 [Actinoplanes sp. NPDC051633]|uniref:hypothetical protein n=1 Tax=Actinoplanes sp. NPDC051633 TaxID=3155670 RepID=UPI0034319F74
MTTPVCPTCATQLSHVDLVFDSTDLGEFFTDLFDCPDGDGTYCVDFDDPTATPYPITTAGGTP